MLNHLNPKHPTLPTEAEDGWLDVDGEYSPIQPPTDANVEPTLSYPSKWLSRFELEDRRSTMVQLLKGAADAHHTFEAGLGHPDADWPTFYADWILANSAITFRK